MARDPHPLATAPHPLTTDPREAAAIFMALNPERGAMTLIAVVNVLDPAACGRDTTLGVNIDDHPITPMLVRDCRTTGESKRSDCQDENATHE